jgi:hypothetical protein
MTAPESRELSPGTVVAGKLRVVRQLGVGGMGAVYEVEHEMTRHHRALKVLHPAIAQSPALVARFLREASAAGHIGNPHIAETFDAGRLGSGEPYILMEMLEGETLDLRLRRLGPIAPGELADLVCQACDGVQAAHDAGIVHRDLKPENLFLTPARDGATFVKILDFGISKFDADRTGHLGVTAEGAIMGTPFYMPPEQVRGEASIDSRADVYALGVILYECASGVRPFDAQTLERLAILIHEGKATALGERVPSLPPELCAIVHRAMAVERDDRYPTARALAEALAPFRAVAAPRTLASEPPRVVIRPSMAPAENPASATVAAATITETALADTLGTGAAARRSRLWPGLLGAAVVVGGVAVGVVHLRSTPPAAGGLAPAAPAALDVPSAMPPHAAAASAQVLAPLPVVEAAPEAGAPAHASIAAASRPAAVASAPAIAAAPAQADAGARGAAPGGKSRVDQTGLAGENPFR